MSVDVLHPILATWFEETFGVPTEPQRLGWPAIARRENILIAAPTGSGKTLAAFLVCIDRLVREAMAGALKDECRVLYLSPLRALASDIRKNLEIPLAEIQARVARQGLEIPEIRSQVRTGDTPSHVRQAIVRKPPHILVTTPESLYLMLTSEKGREALSTVETVIVDEIHALARDKRGSHMALSLERLKALTGRPPAFIGLSATQKPVEQMASFLVGVGKPCTVFDIGHSRKRDLGLLLPETPLNTVCSHEQWEEIYQKIALEIRNHRSTLLFVNTRRLAERVAFRLAEILGDAQILCHHGSLSKDRRTETETMLKEGRLKAIVATASLELGIDIGYIDLVCQIGIPYSIASFLQRIGRSGHAIRSIPKGRLVPLTRDELIESFALLRSVREQQLDRIEIPIAPLDILTQHLIAECATLPSGAFLTVDEAFRRFTGAWPYRALSRESFGEVVNMAAEGFAAGRRRSAYLMWDRLQDRLTAKAGARLAALTSGGSIPEMGDFRVVLEDDGTVVGSVNEDFAIESLAGDVFILGTHSWRVRHVRGGEMVVQDAQGQPPSIPFWLGEAPGRTEEFSTAVSQLRKEMGEFFPEGAWDDPKFLAPEALPQLRELPSTPFDEAVAWLGEKTQTQDRWALLQAVYYIAVQKAALGLIPTQERVVFERFFDEAGGMQLVIHSPYGARLNRGWGLALRKRFCRSFDFELQASADDDGIVLSLGPGHSFPVEQLFKMLNLENIEHFLTQALLDSPMFAARWRWNATRALAVLRSRSGKRVPPALQRFRSEDLLTAVFPAQTACQENAPGDKEIPDHPLVRQSVYDCLHEAMDLPALKRLFAAIEKGNVELIGKDTREPSPFAYQLLNAYPYAFLDEAALEDRRTRSVAMRPALSIQDLQNLDRMDPKAIAVVTDQAFPKVVSAEELYEVLVASTAFPLSRTDAFKDLKDVLLTQKRATIARVNNEGFSVEFLVAAEAIPVVKVAYEEIRWSAEIPLPASISTPLSCTEARQAILRGWLEIQPPTTEAELSALFAIADPSNLLQAIEATGSILQCRIGTPGPEYSHWCSRAILRRIHRLTIEGLREQIRPVTPQDYLEFLFEEHGLNLASPEEKFPRSEGLSAVIAKLQGFEAPAIAWECELFAGRMPGSYQPSFLDQLTSNGSVAFGRLTPKKAMASPQGKSQKMTPQVPLSFILRRDWSWIAVNNPQSLEQIARHSSNSSAVFQALQTGGAQFIDEIESATGLLHTQVAEALSEMAAAGSVTCDQFHAFRRQRGRARVGAHASTVGRWSLMRYAEMTPERREQRLERWASQLLARYGIVFRDLLERESLAPSWGELVRVFRRWEARGEVRGGRFISGVAGEQFGLAETHEKLLQVREERAQGKRQESYTVISSADPLNLVGYVTQGTKIPSHPSTRILFIAGELAGICRADELELFRPVSNDQTRALRLIGTFRTKGLRRALTRPRGRPALELRVSSPA